MVWQSPASMQAKILFLLIGLVSLASASIASWREDTLANVEQRQLETETGQAHPAA